MLVPEPNHTVVFSRLNCRVDSRIKQRAEEAAHLLGQSITDFTEMAIAEKADAVLAQSQQIRLSERDFVLFVASLENPAPPTQRLREAVADYGRLKEENPEGNW
ncbi:MAG: DUF1778 domain-containing protein [Armatimonadaceae bacterium]